MKKNVFVLFMFLCTWNIGAQEAVDAEYAAKSKEINNIKKTGNVVYAEVYELAADDEAALELAKRKSVNKLQTSIVEAASAELNMDKEDVKAIFDVIDDKCQNIVITSGDLRRVFTYIVKDRIGLSRKKTKDEDYETYFGEEKDSAEMTLMMEETVNRIMDGQDSINNVVPQPEINVLPKDTVVAKKEQVVEENPIEITPVEEEKPVIVVEEPKVQPAPEVVVPDLCLKVIDAKTWKEVQLYLKQEQARGSLMFGGKAKMQFHDKCYIAVFDKSSQNLVALFDKGGSERMNFISKQNEDSEKYLKPKSGYSALYIQVY